ncbi:MAG: PEP-CTERM sorting domain-containing protein [Chthoniobacterales bacterium]
MKKFIITALAAAAVSGSTSFAALTYNSDDLVIAFSTSSTVPHTGNTYLVDFGNLSDFIGAGAYATGTHVVNAGQGSAYLADLAAASISLGTATFSIQSANFDDSSLTLSKARTSSGTQSVAFGNGSTGGANGDMLQMFLSLGTTATTTTASNSFSQSTGDDASYGKFVFGSLSPTQAYERYTNPEGSLSQTLDLYAATINGTGNATYLGNFTFNTANGNLSFTAVPEPSTYALLGLGALGLLFKATRRNKNAA